MTLELLLRPDVPGDLLALLTLRGTVVFAVGALLLSLVGGAEPRVERTLLNATFAAYAVVVVLTALPLFEGVPAITLGPFERVPESDPTASPVADWLVLIWITGGAVALLRLLVGYAAVTRMALGSKADAVPGWLRVRFTDLAAECGVRRPVRLLIAADVSSPATWGVLRPVVALPPSCLALDRSRLDAVLRHELEHVRAFDAASKWLVSVAEVTLWFHPLVALLRWRREDASEFASDRVAVSGCDDPVTYARTLVDFGSRSRARSVAWSSGMGLRGGRLSERIRRIITPAPPGPRRGGSPLGALFLLGVCVLLVLSLKPTWTITMVPSVPAAEADRAVHPETRLDP